MKQYQDLLRHIQENGRQKDRNLERTGTGCRSVFGYQMRFDLSEGNFPLVTTKSVPFRMVVQELLWFLSGSTNIRPLVENDVHIWDAWAIDNGELGPVYGAMWRSWPAGKENIDQIDELMSNLRDQPFSRRHIVSAWNPAYLPDESISPQENVRQGRQALPPCHTMFQFHVEEMTFSEINSVMRQQGILELCPFTDPHEALGAEPEFVEGLNFAREAFLTERNVPTKRLSCQLYQRSADVFLGLPFNIASYSLLTMMMAQCLNMHPGEFVHTLGDAHIYDNHITQVQELLTREPVKLPYVVLNPGITNLFDFTEKDIKLVCYLPHPAIKAPIAV